MSVDATGVAAGVVLLLAVLSAVDLHQQEAGSLTIYTTPALRDLLEKGILPAWRDHGGMRVEPVYVAAGQEYNRLRMSGSTPEADLFMHASPLFIARGYDEGYFLPIDSNLSRGIDPEYYQAEAPGALAWIAFAWSPLVEVYSTRLPATPDLANASLRYGLPHPSLSNNGIYAVLFLEQAGATTGSHALARTVVQPVNARSNIMGIADGSFDLTLGYEAVAIFFERQGAAIQWATPLVEGRRVTTPILFSVGLVDGPHTESARRFIDFLFTNQTQQILPSHHFRSIHDTLAATQEGADLSVVHFNWRDWRSIERTLPEYEVSHSRA